MKVFNFRDYCVLSWNHGKREIEVHFNVPLENRYYCNTYTCMYCLSNSSFDDKKLSYCLKFKEVFPRGKCHPKCAREAEKAATLLEL